MAAKTRRRAKTSSEAQKVIEDETPLDPSELPHGQQQRRARIVRSALRMLQRSEYVDIQMRDVGERADVALGTVYRYFSSKERLFAAVLIEWSRSMHEGLQSDPPKGDDVAARLNDIMGRAFDAFERRPQVFRVVMALEDSTDAHTLSLLQEFSELARQSFSEPLKELAPEDVEAVVNVVTAILSDALRGTAMGWLTMGQARARMVRGIELIFSPAPKPQRRPRRLPAAAAV